MARGGKREGAGRPVGATSRAGIAQAIQAAATGETPLEYMLRVMRDGTIEHPRRDEMAKAAAPYVHNKLSAVEHTGKDGADLMPAATDPRELAKAIVSALGSAVKPD